jgi:hypothetical protein
MNVYDDALRHIFSQFNLLAVPRLRILSKRFRNLVDEYIHEEEEKLPVMTYAAPGRNRITVSLHSKDRKRWHLVCSFNQRRSKRIFLGDLENGETCWMDRDCMVRIASSRTIAVKYCIWWDDEVDVYEHIRRIPDEWPTFSDKCLEFSPRLEKLFIEHPA